MYESIEIYSRRATMKISYIRLEKIDSTQTYAKTLASSLSPDTLICVVAEEQTKGRGRHQRKWVSPCGLNLYVTLCFELTTHVSEIGTLAQSLAVTTASLLVEKGLQPQIKWPNDLQIDQKKIGGILCEVEFTPQKALVFLGIGLNVNMEKQHLQAIDQPATSLKEVTGSFWNKEILLQELVEKWAQDLEQFKKKGFSYFYPQLVLFLAYHKQNIRYFDGVKTWEGVLDSVSPGGELNIRLASGEIKTFSSGDCDPS